MQLPDRYRTPWQLCRAVEDTFPADKGRLVRRPFNHYDPDYTNWYLVPSLALPFFKFGKYHFAWDEKVRQEIRLGIIVTKGLDPALKAAYPSKRGKRLLMDDSWAWTSLLDGMRSGALERAIREAAQRSGQDVFIEITGGYIDDPGLFDPDQDYRKKDRYCLTFSPAANTVTVTKADRSAMCLKFLNQVRDPAGLQKAFETLSQEAFLWCDIFIGIACRWAADDAGAASPEELRQAVLDPFAPWVR
ncbi:MAG: hypothetical protein IJC34_08020 [Lentisphaeria bacterium]|nr:hypothetical protein [Lentisphaeria bacterium]